MNENDIQISNGIFNVNDIVLRYYHTPSSVEFINGKKVQKVYEIRIPDE